MTDLTGHVHATLAKHYPQHVLGWVKQATWTRDPAVPLSRIDMSRRPGGRDPQKVAGIAQAVTDGKPMPPVVLVDTGDGKLQIADGYHRTLGFQHAGKTKIPALIASGVGAHGPWEKRMHDAKLNLTAEHVHVFDLAGTCTGPGPCDTSSFGAGKNWVNKVGGLPDYIRAVAHAFRRKGLSESEAIQRAVGVVKNWAEGKGGVTPATRARAAAAVAQWEAMKAKSHSLTASPSKHMHDLADAIVATTDSPTLTFPAETALIRTRAKTATFPHKFQAAKWTHPNGHPRCKNCGQEQRTSGVCTKPATKPTAGPATSISMAAAPASTVDLAEAGHVYHWKHGWIPITPHAALQKAHGSHAGAARILHKNGQHQDAHAMLARGLAHHEAKGNKGAAERYRKALADHKATAPRTGEGSHFRMSGTELRDRAANGDKAAQAELDRRSARKTEKAGGPPKAPEPRTPAPPSAPEVPKQPEPPISRPLSPEGAYMRDRGTMAPRDRVTAARELFGPDSEEYKNAVSAENAHIEGQLTRFPSAGPGHTIRSSVQNRYQRALAGTMESKPYATLHQHEIANPNGSSYGLTIGRVQERHDQPGVFHAEHVTYKQRGRIARSEYHDLGTFDSREKAHKAIAVVHNQHQTKITEKRVKEAATAQRKASAAQGVAGPGGTKWAAVNPNDLLASSVGSEVKKGRTADQVAAKARQTFKAGNYTVTVEANLSTERTKRLLSDITTAVDATPIRNHEVHFVVPTGHSGFKGGAGGFVYAGGRTVYLNPTLVSGAKTHLFTQGDTTDFHMPASAHLGHDSNVSTIVHELGHVHDNINGHTRGGGQTIFYGNSGGFAGTPSRFHGEVAPTMARYARKNPAEGYAEAFMQYHVGGHGSHPAADAYATHYGWGRTAGIAANRGSHAA